MHSVRLEDDPSYFTSEFLAHNLNDDISINFPFPVFFFFLQWGAGVCRLFH